MKWTERAAWVLLLTLIGSGTVFAVTAASVQSSIETGKGGSWKTTFPSPRKARNAAKILGEVIATEINAVSVATTQSILSAPIWCTGGSVDANFNGGYTMDGTGTDTCVSNWMVPGDFPASNTVFTARPVWLLSSTVTGGAETVNWTYTINCAADNEDHGSTELSANGNTDLTGYAVGDLYRNVGIAVNESDVGALSRGMMCTFSFRRFGGAGADDYGTLKFRGWDIEYAAIQD